MNMPRFDLMRSHIDMLRVKHCKDGVFIRSVLNSPYGKGFYADNAMNYARTLLND